MNTTKTLSIVMSADGEIVLSAATMPADTASTIISITMPPETNNREAAQMLRRVASELEV